MKKCKFAKTIAIIAVALTSVFIIWFVINWKTKANPDYICVKSVTNQPCIITTCDAWQTNWSRTCHWTRTTAVQYYLVRTTCEPGYQRIYQSGNWMTESWRQGADYQYSSEACSIIQTDTVPPVWRWDVIN